MEKYSSATSLSDDHLKKIATACNIQKELTDQLAGYTFTMTLGLKDDIIWLSLVNYNQNIIQDKE